MHSTTSMWIQASPDDVFALVSDLDTWKQNLPHYRYVKVLRRTHETTHAAMSARRGLIPVFWEAIQIVDHERHAIQFRHVRGITKGMEVVWSFTPERGGTMARVDHDLDFKVPVVRGWLAERILAREFIEPIVKKTLSCFRDVAEADARVRKGRTA